MTLKKRGWTGWKFCVKMDFGFDPNFTLQHRAIGRFDGNLGRSIRFRFVEEDEDEDDAPADDDDGVSQLSVEWSWS